MAESKAARLASGFSSDTERIEESDLKGQRLPENVQAAILDVEAASHSIQENVELAEKLWADNPEHPLALEPGEHSQTSWAQRFEVVDGEVVEILKESADSPVQVIYRPDLKPVTEVDAASALEARLTTPLSDEEKGAAQEAAEALAAEQVRDD
jgi:hypothetical protein